MVLIRKSNPIDLNTIIQLKLRMFSDAGLSGLLNKDAAEIIEREYIKMNKQDRIKHFVIELDNEIVGCAGGFIKDDIPYCFYEAPYYGFIGDVYIRPEYRRNGYARRLTEEVVAWLKSKEVKMIKLLATPEAKRLYESIGFSKTDEMILRI